jgi:hypothetical protein
MSRWIADRTGGCAATGPAAVDEGLRKTVELTADDLVDFSRRTRQCEEEGERMFREHPLDSVYHEDLTDAPLDELKRITDFLGEAQHRLRTPLVKQNPEKLCDSSSTTTT